MKCPTCQFDCPDGMKFCGLCGARLERLCLDCHHPNPLSFRFCGNCGAALATPAERESLRDLSAFRRLVPEALAARALADCDALPGERRHVTVLFCDMAGFTRLTEAIGSEAAYSMMDRIYEILIRKVYEYEGTVNELTGDGIMALFGAPVALEDAPQRAIRSAIAIHREMARFSEVIRAEREGMPRIRMRVGLHTGPVVVGRLGNDLKLEFKAVGDTVNLASRMESIATPGSTYVTEATFRLTEGLFRFEALGKRQLKGVRTPPTVYRVIAAGTSRSRFDVSAERGLAPFLGRGRELELLLDAFERVREGRGQAYSIVAEAGVGKSRLLYEFSQAVSNENVTFLEGRCLSYTRGLAFHPVVDMLRSNFGIHDDDAHAEIRSKVERGFTALSIDQPALRQHLLELLAVEPGRGGDAQSTAALQRQRFFETVDRIVLKGSEVRPLILAVEDIHWIDKGTEEYMKHLVATIGAARVLVVLTYRPEFTVTWGAKSYHGQINLSRLSNRESLTLVRHLLAADRIAAPLEELILEKTDGIPLFIEEFARSLVALDLVVHEQGLCMLAPGTQDMAVPATIQDVIMARVDGLDDDARAILKTGSVIEREFSHELLRRVTEMDETRLLAGLSALKDAELLYERGIYPQCTYVFKHPLTREVVYSSILTAGQRELHGRVGRAIEELYAADLSEQHAILARHFLESGDARRGAMHSERAAKQAMQRGAIQDAIAHARQWVACYENLPATEDVQRRIVDARTVLAGYHLSWSDLVGAKEAVFDILGVAEERGFQDRLPGIYTALGLYRLWIEEDFAAGVEYLEDAVRLSERAGSSVWDWYASFYLGGHLCWDCEFARGRDYLARALRTSAVYVPGQVEVRGVMAMQLAYEGRIEPACEQSAECLRLARQDGYIVAREVAHTSHGVCSYFRGALTEAMETLREGLALIEQAPQPVFEAMMWFILGNAHADLGEYRQALECCERGATTLETARLLPSLMQILKISAARARALESGGEVELNVLPARLKRNKLRLWEGFVARDLAEIHLAVPEGTLATAESWLQHAIDVDTARGLHWFLARDLTLLADLCRRREERTCADTHLRRAIAMYGECGAHGHRERAEQMLTALAGT
jgi:class 3 adenylate cyclase/tetratricopeptide (TPR) repeat protein